MKKIENDKGVTLVALAVTIVILTVLAVTLTASATSTIELKQYNRVKEDIIALSEEVKVYYVKNNKLPIYNEKEIDLKSYGVPDKDMNPNDSGNYYPIDVTKLSSDIELNCGNGNKNKDFTTDDLYVVNESSLTVYYLKGIYLNKERHYTIIDDFSGGSFANEYYSKVDLPIISVVTMESSGRDKTLASVNDTVTLRMLSNYTLTKTPSVTIAGHAVDVTWNGKIGIATYTFPSLLTADEADYVGRKIELSIDDYEADGRTGETINDVNFGDGVFLYAKEKKLKVGDYVNYNYDIGGGSYILTSDVSGYSNNQTISQPLTKLNWRILSINDDGSIDLISETPTDMPVYFGGALGYNNGVYALNDICEKLFSNSYLKIKARSINVEDIEKQETPQGTTKRMEFDNGISKYGNTKTYTGDVNYYPNLYAHQNGSGIDTITVKTDGISESDETTSGYTMPTTETYSRANSAEGLTVSQTGYYNIDFNNENYGKASSVLISNPFFYWVASRYSSCSENRADFGLRSAAVNLNYYYLYFSDKNVDVHGNYLRPVVTLKNNIKVDSSDLSKDGSSADLAYDIVVK